MAISLEMMEGALLSLCDTAASVSLDCSDSSAVCSSPSSFVDVKQRLLQRTGHDFTGHLHIMWRANCSCKRAGYSEATVDDLAESWGEGETRICLGLPSPLDVPTRDQAAARESAAEMVWALRQMARLVWPEDVHTSTSSDPAASYAEWEMVQDELLSSSDQTVREGWGEGLWCFNPRCDNLSGPSELQLKTYACDGGCGVRYCSQACQAQGWRDGHRLSCG